MTPEQKQFYNELLEAMIIAGSPEYKANIPDEILIVLVNAAKKLHDLWPTLCELVDKEIDVELMISLEKTEYGYSNKIDYKTAGLKLSEARPTISKAVGGGDE